MWQRSLQRASFKVLTVPISLAAALVRLFAYRSIIDDLNNCISVVHELRPKYPVEISDSLLHTLIIAEDHRSSLHYGIDPFAIIRALKVRVTVGRTQGASTIEQQLVRRVTRRYEKTPRRKIREQIIAVMLSSELEKKEIASAYLKIAYYGSNLSGGLGIRTIMASGVDNYDAVIVAYLKYPKSLLCIEPNMRHSNRVAHIRALVNGDVDLLWLDQGRLLKGA